MTMEEQLHSRLANLGVAEIAAAPADSDAPAGMKYSQAWWCGFPTPWWRALRDSPPTAISTTTAR